MNTRSFWLSALIAGAAIGVVAHLPVLNLINCILCIWVWLGGMLAVLLYRRFQRGQPPALTPGQGAGLGAVAGVLGAIFGFFVNLLTNAISFPIFMSIARYFELQRDVPFDDRSIPGLITGALFFMCLDILLYPLFGALSGLITASVGRKGQTPEVAA
jgi:hypothetical protein